MNEKLIENLKQHGSYSKFHLADIKKSFSSLYNYELIN